MNTEQIQPEEKRLLDFCHFLGGSGYKINGYDDSQLLVIIGKFFHAYGRSAGLEREKEYREFIEEVSKVSYSPFSDEVFKIREKAKQLLNRVTTTFTDS